MGNLYRRETLPSGRHRYVETSEWFTGDPADGLWIVRKHKAGRSMSFITDKVSSLPGKPDPETLAWVAARMNEMADTVLAVSGPGVVIDGRRMSMSPAGMARAIVERLMMEAADQPHGQEG